MDGGVIERGTLAQSNECKRSVKKKEPSLFDDSLFLAGPTGFEPAISSVTGRHVRPLHHEPVIKVLQNTSILTC